MEDFLELIRKRRTIRQFRAEEIPANVLLELADLGRLAPSAANLQPLEFIIVQDPEVRRQVFPWLRWAAYINPAGNPKPGQEPAAYIVIVVNTGIRQKGYEYDVGAAAENIILGALTQGLGSCWLISVDRERLNNILEIPEEYRIDSVLALGYPAESPVVENFQGSVKYWKDENETLHVPKRELADVVHLNRFGRRIKG
ncbi:MAG: nitroreductase family protein [Candidatus Saccharicenans sp.]|jgi:nitroreductase|nr:nitroreductase family protein [Candidatus Saccharicenans sp.]MDH7575026.1 nitroreductase family protein [Candidatus Saccharicenans sp.]